MNTTEISPGVFIDSGGAVYKKLKICEYCGKHEVLSSPKYTNMCVECGKSYNLYTVRKAARKRGDMSLKAAISYEMQLERLVDVFNGVEEELTATRNLIAYYKQQARDKLMNSQIVEVKCIYCSEPVYVPAGTKAVKCADCEELYEEYTKLRRNISVLYQDDCDRLAELLRILGKYRSFATCKRALQRRIVAIGGERYVNL